MMQVSLIFLGSFFLLSFVWNACMSFLPERIEEVVHPLSNLAFKESLAVWAVLKTLHCNEMAPGLFSYQFFIVVVLHHPLFDFLDWYEFG